MRASCIQLLKKDIWHCYDVGRLQYLIELSNIHDVNPYCLLDSFVKAQKGGTARCGPLEITARRREDEYTVYLVTRKRRIVTQIRLRNELWRNLRRTRTNYSIMVEHEKISRMTAPVIWARETAYGDYA